MENFQSMKCLEDWVHDQGIIKDEDRMGGGSQG